MYGIDGLFKDDSSTNIVIAHGMLVYQRVSFLFEVLGHTDGLVISFHWQSPSDFGGHPSLDQPKDEL